MDNKLITPRPIEEIQAELDEALKAQNETEAQLSVYKDANNGKVCREITSVALPQIEDKLTITRDKIKLLKAELTVAQGGVDEGVSIEPDEELFKLRR